MYRCTECKEEFKEKPDYCTCGNDEFEEFLPQHKPCEIGQKQEKLTRPNIEFKQFEMAKIFSIGFFCLCLVLAIIPWLIKTEKPIKTVKKAQEEVTKTIPDIENIWQNSQPAPTVAETISEAKPEPAPVIVETKENKKVQSAPIQKPATTQKPQQKPVSKPIATTPTNPIEEALSQKPSSQPNTKLPQSVLNTLQNTTSTQQTVQQPVKKEEPPKMNPSEFLNYKGAIRSALLAKLNVAAVQGSGDCAVEFSLDNSGKLINRNFIYKSQNKSVNDEVYLMLMRLPYYKNPPAHYNGEKIKLKFLFNNGYYEITFI
mgnify:FL=1